MAPPTACALVVGDIVDAELVDPLVAEHDAIVHFAAESHNDNSLDAPCPFVETNLVGTYTILEAVRKHGAGCTMSRPTRSTATSSSTTRRFTEDTPYNPSSPYSGPRPAPTSWSAPGYAASACRRPSRTAPTTTGPGSTSRNSFPARSPTSSTADAQALRLGERPRLDPRRRPLSVRLTILEKGEIGETYLIGADGEKNNLEVVKLILGYGRPRTTSTTSPTAPDTTCATRSSPPSCAGARLAAAVPGLRGRAGRHHRLVPRTRTGGARTSRPPRRRTRPKGSDA